MKEKIAKLKIIGRVFIWKYSDNIGNYPDWNLSVDKLASKELSNLLDMMNECEWSTNKTISTSKPTESEIAVPNNQNGNAKWLTKPAIIFCTKSSFSPHHWVINEMPDSIEINFGKQKLQRLKEAIISIPSGNGDFSIADENQKNILTFWWNSRK